MKFELRIDLVMLRFLIILIILIFVSFSKAQEMVQMTLESSGTFSVPCELNGLQLRFTFDTGASHVSLSSVEADYMLNNGYLSKSDFLDKRTYSLANGKEEEDQVVNIKTLKIGNRTLHDVKACISTETKASLLLGQSALRRLGRYMVDGDVLILYPYTEEDSVKNAKMDLAAFTLKGKHTQTYEIGTYTGYYKNGFRDSTGIMIYNDVAKYDGQWKNNQYEGYGVYTSANGDRYVGQYHAGEFDGKGKFTRADGSCYDGEWKQGKCNGKLKAVFADGSSYDGDWVDGEMNGSATIIFTSGNKYVGAVVKGKCNGSGKMTYANGDTYDGTSLPQTAMARLPIGMNWDVRLVLLQQMVMVLRLIVMNRVESREQLLLTAEVQLPIVMPKDVSRVLSLPIVMVLRPTEIIRGVHKELLPKAGIKFV